MALAIDASSPAVVKQATNSTANTTTASFTPPAGSILLIRYANNSASGVNPSAPTITDNRGTHLTYTPLDWQSRADSPNVDGQVATWWANVTSSVAMTVTVTSGVATNVREAALSVIVITGQHATTPIGAHGKTGSSSASSIAQNYTASATSGWGFLGVCDWNATGAETAGSGCTIESSGDVSVEQISYAFARRTTADDSIGSTNTLRTTLGATSSALVWAWVEVLPAASTNTEAPAEAATATAAAQDATGAVSPPAGGSAATAAAQDATASTGASGGGVAVAAAAQDAAASVTTATENAGASASALDATVTTVVSGSASAEAAAGTASAQDATGSVGAAAQAPSATASALDATVTTSSNATAQATEAAASAAAQDASITLTTPAAAAAVTAQALDATVLIGVLANAECASATVSADVVSLAVQAQAEAAAALVTALDATAGQPPVAGVLDVGTSVASLGTVTSTARLSPSTAVANLD